jgi:hypothetical protein
MDQQSIVKHLNLNGSNAVEVHNDFVATLKGEAKSDSTATYYLRNPSFSSPKTPQPSETPAPHLLSKGDKHARAHLSFELFEMLQHQKDRA